MTLSMFDKKITKIYFLKCVCFLFKNYFRFVFALIYFFMILNYFYVLMLKINFKK